MRMAIVAGALLLGVTLPFSVWAQTATPAATYSARGRVLSAIDDELEGIAYTRTQFSLVEVTKDSGPATAPALGAGSTVTTIVRDAAARARVKSLNTSSTIDFRLAWFDENTYEVISLVAPTTEPTTQPLATPTPAPSVTREILLFVVAAAIAGAVLVLLRHRTRV